MTLYRLTVTYPDGELDSLTFAYRHEAEAYAAKLRRESSATVHVSEVSHEPAEHLRQRPNFTAPFYGGYVKGGQGRTAASVRQDSTVLWFTVATIIVLLALCALREATA